MSVASPSSLAYVAGFVDGEGCLTISSNGSVVLSIVNTSSKVLHFVKETLGLGVVQDRAQKTNKRQYVFRAYGENCMMALELLLPYLIEKKPQAVLMRHYREHCKPIRKPGIKGQFSNPHKDRYIQELKAFKKHEN